MIGVAGLRFHHFGLAASDPDKAAAFVQQLGYECGSSVVDPLQNVQLRWCEKVGSPSIEIVSATDTDGPLTKILAMHPTSFYHLCFEIEVSGEEMVDSLRASGSRVVTVIPPTPAVLFNGRLVSFHFVQGFGLIELLQNAVCGHG